MLTFELHRRALKQAEFVLTRQLAKRNHRAAEGDRADGCAQRQLQPVAIGNRPAHAIDRLVGDAKGPRLQGR